MSPDRREVAARVARESPPRPRARKNTESKPKREQGTALGLSDPEPWPEPVCGRTLLTELVTTLRRFVALPEGADITLALWVLHAHAHDAAEVSPLLVLTSPEKQCGKTTTLHVLRGLVPRALLASNITTATLFRMVEKLHPTLLVDEADTFLPDREELRGILNSGHVRASATVVRSVGEDFEPRSFTTWAPKVIAQIGRLHPTLEDRAIVVRLRRRAPNEIVDRLRLDRLPRLLGPLDMLAARWALDNAVHLHDADPEVPSRLSDRAQDNWRPLLAIAEAIGAEWPGRARQAALALSGAVPEGDGALGIQLLTDLQEMFGSRMTDRLSSEDIVSALEGLEERPWAEMKAGKPISKAQLARLLKPYDVEPRTIRIGDATLRGYLLEDLADAFSRYLPAEVQRPQQGSNDAGEAHDPSRNTAGSVAPHGAAGEPLLAPLVADVAGWGPLGEEAGKGADDVGRP